MRQVGSICNPVVILPEGKERKLGASDEGCLSLPGAYLELARPDRAICRGQDALGRPIEVEGTGLLSRCLQHETDHLDGVLFIDRMDTPRRRAALRALHAAPWAQDGAPRVKISPHAAPNPFR